MMMLTEERNNGVGTDSISNSADSTPEERISNYPKDRPEVRGKFLFIGGSKFWIKGVAYAPPTHDEPGADLPSPDRVERDFAAFAENGLNCVRTHDVPPTWLLDAAVRHGLRVIIGLAWVEHMAFLDDKELVLQIETGVLDGVGRCAGHPAVLCYAIGDKIPSAIVRWHGCRRIERFIKRLYDIAKARDPGCLVTYVNQEATEFLRLPFLDFFCFDVRFDTPGELRGYLARLQNLTSEKPLVMTEIAPADEQIETPTTSNLLLKVRTAFSAGCAGVIPLDWMRHQARRDRDLKEALPETISRTFDQTATLRALRDAYAESPFPSGFAWPKITVVVCSFNGEPTIRA